MKIVCISDTHCQLDSFTIPDGDILVHAGDALSRGTYKEFVAFMERFSKLPHPYKIYVPGNHDRVTEMNEHTIKKECEENNVIYLNDSGAIVLGLSFWGSAITPRFHDWAWNRDSGSCGTSVHPKDVRYRPIKPHWDLIPTGLDFLVTHGPPHGILDLSVYSGDRCGCTILLDKIKEVKPKYHVFGHIHQFGGQSETIDGTTFINASVCDEQYLTTNKPYVLEIDND